MPVSDFELVQSWRQVLDLCKLQNGQSVTILTSQGTNEQTLRCAILAVQEQGAFANRLDLQPSNGGTSFSRDPLAYVGTTPLTGNRAAVEMLKASDLVLDLMTLLFSAEQHEILEAGGRILLAVEPPDVLVRMTPTAEDRERVLAASAKLRVANTMKVTSAAGTDATFALGEYPILEEYGFVEKPGRWDHWPSGFLATWANEARRRAGSCSRPAISCCLRKATSRHRSPAIWKRAMCARSRAVSRPTICAITWKASMTPKCMRCRISAGAFRVGRTGPSWAFMTVRPASAWIRVPVPETSCGQRDRTTKREAIAIRPVILISRCAIAQ